MKRKCKLCFKGNINSYGECDSCGAIDIHNETKGSQYLFYGRCELCGGEGRIIEKGDGRGKMVFYRCYECWCKEFNNERINRANVNNCPKPAIIHGGDDYQDYLKVIDECFHKPRFYNRSPNWTAINNSSWKLLKAEVNDNQKKVMQAFEDKEMSNLIFKDN